MMTRTTSADGGRSRDVAVALAAERDFTQTLPMRKRIETIAALALVALVALATALGAQQSAPTPAADSVPAVRLAAREWFRDARFGLFIHWGVYSLLGRAEWVMENQKIPVGTYEWLASTFDPVKFDAHTWVSLAKAAGVRYITITARHHDGFSMFATKATPYNIVDWTRFGRDPLKELADECRRQGIKLFFYYSQLDWHNPDYWPRGQTGHYTQRPDTGNWNHYLNFMDTQLTELLTNYGPVGGIWFDGMWDKPDADWQLAQDVRAHPPAAARGADRSQSPPGAQAGRGRADLRAGSAGRQHRRLQHDDHRRPSARDVA